MKKRYVIFTVLLIVLSSIVVVPSHAETITKNSTLKHFDVTLTFPKSANPGDSILISMTAEARSSISVRDLSIQILAYTEGGDLQSIGSASLATDQYVHKGDKLHKELSVTVSTSIPRGALVAVVSETTRSTTYAYYSYPLYYYYYDYPYNSYYPYYYAYYYPETYSQEYVESKTLPGTYVLAPTPEYVKLKSDYDKLSSDYDTLSSQYSELSVKYQQATEQNQELSDKLSMTTQDLNATRILVFVFVAATVILAAYLLYMHRRVMAVPATGIPVSNAPAAGASLEAQPEKIVSAPEKKEIPKKETTKKT